MNALHPLQIEIFERLRTAPSGLRFAEMCPDGIESDLYNYHLRYLVKNDRVDKLAGKYYLSDVGREFIADLAPLRLGKPQLLKIASMCLVLRNTKVGTEVLYQKRTRQPHAGEWLMVAGGVRRGESVLTAASRRLQEEAGMKTTFKWLGTLRKIRLRSDNTTVWSDITYHICIAREPVGIPATTRFGEHHWIGKNKAADFERTQSVGSSFLAGLLKALDSDVEPTQGFYVEETHNQNAY